MRTCRYGHSAQYMEVICEFGHLAYPAERKRKQMKIIDRTIMLVNLVGENIAQILILHNPETDDKWAIGYPFMGMHEMARQDLSNPILLMDAQQFMPQSFLGWIATVIRGNKNAQVAYRLQSYDPPDGKFHSILLVEGMDARNIAGITGFDIEMVRDYYRNYFVVKVD